MQPNIILINCDDLGYGDLGCYGSPKNSTPAIDRMAEEGNRFTDFYMASPVCSPSRGALLTGCYPKRIGFASFHSRGFPNTSTVLFPGDPEGLHPDEVTIAKLLKNVGYTTKMIGKWHCGDQKEFLPTKHGFDTYLGLPYSNDMGIQFEDDDYPPLPLLQDEEVIATQPDQSLITDLYTKEALSFIEQSKEEPFFLYFAHMYVHLPIYVKGQLLNDSDNGKYGAAVSAIDISTGEILDKLKELGIDDNTLVIFTSDNGSRNRDEGGSNYPLKGHKGLTWEGGMRVPCIMRWPNHIPSGIVKNELTTSMDIYPTLASFSQGKVPSDRIIDGIDMSESLLNRNSEFVRENFFYYNKENLEAVRSDDWKLHVYKTDRRDPHDQSGELDTGIELKELYNLKSDPSETVNMYTDRPDIVDTLESMLSDCRDDIGDGRFEIIGNNVREVGVSDNPDTLLPRYNKNDPNVVAMYDLEDRG
jgi:arylsulfatase A-like enzyme